MMEITFNKVQCFQYYENTDIFANLHTSDKP